MRRRPDVVPACGCDTGQIAAQHIEGRLWSAADQAARPIGVRACTDYHELRVYTRNGCLNRLAGRLVRQMPAHERDVVVVEYLVVTFAWSAFSRPGSVRASGSFMATRRILIERIMICSFLSWASCGMSSRGVHGIHCSELCGRGNPC